MAALAQLRSPRSSDPVVDRYVAEFRRRHRQMEQTRNLELRQIGLDVFTRTYHEYFALPSKTAFEVLLQVILEPDERDRIQIDPQFTQAWQIFLDLCWIRARAVRLGIILGATVVLGILIALVIFSGKTGSSRR